MTHGPMVFRHPMLVLLPAALMLAACPARVSHEPPPADEGAEVAKLQKDERVVEYEGDFYPARNFEKGLGAPSNRAPGSGIPDETNGLCRLYAPKLPEPECCKGEYGFDVGTVQQTCGLGVYLGESFHLSCGYFFHRDQQPPTWMRMSFSPGGTAQAAARAHDLKLQRALEDPSFRSRPVPGVRGARWSSNDGLNWAFLPGWSKVRQLTWRDEACDRDAIIEVMRALIQAKEPPKNAPRRGLVPKSRT